MDDEKTTGSESTGSDEQQSADPGQQSETAGNGVISAEEKAKLFAEFKKEQDAAAAASAKEIDRERLATQIRTLKANPKLWEALQEGMDGEAPSPQLKQALEQIEGLQQERELDKLAREFKLSDDDMTYVKGDTPEERRATAQYLAELRKAAEQADPKANSGLPPDLARLTSLKAGAKRGGEKPLDEALKEFHGN